MVITIEKLKNIKEEVYSKNEIAKSTADMYYRILFKPTKMSRQEFWKLIYRKAIQGKFAVGLVDYLDKRGREKEKEEFRKKYGIKTKLSVLSKEFNKELQAGIDRIYNETGEFSL